MGRRQTLFIKEFVVLFGFLNGVWIAVGVNPGAALWSVVVGWVLRLDPSLGVVFLLALAPLLFLAFILRLIWKRGRWLGLAAVLVGFVGGMLVLSAPGTSLLLLLAAGALAFVGTK